MTGQLFEIGQVYKRSDLHSTYRGNRRSGISPLASFPHILIFSGVTGYQYGYTDRWENPNVFSYTGEGKNGDMRFIRGNLALRDHLKHGKRVFLFMYERKGYVRFEAELEFIDFDYFIAPGEDEKERIAIKFFFKRAGVSTNYPIQKTALGLNPDFTTVREREMPKETERLGLVVSRVGQGAYRKSLLYRWNFKCAVTSYSGKEVLIASHIVPWKHANDDERLDVHNGILLSPVYDALFDTHLISFENNGKIILSDALAKTDYRQLGVTGREAIKDLSRENHLYLERHRSILSK